MPPPARLDGDALPGITLGGSKLCMFTMLEQNGYAHKDGSNQDIGQDAYLAAPHEQPREGVG